MAKIVITEITAPFFEVMSAEDAGLLIKNLIAKQIYGKETYVSDREAAALDAVEKLMAISEKQKSTHPADGTPKQKRSSAFVPPTLEEVSAYCAERKNGVDPVAFYDYYSMTGWKVNGKSVMKDWRAAVRTWERKSKPQGNKQKSAPSFDLEKFFDHAINHGPKL